MKNKKSSFILGDTYHCWHSLIKLSIDKKIKGMICKAWFNGWKQINWNIGILSELCHYVNSDILVKLTYGLISWGNMYSSTTQPLFILQKWALKVMTFSKFHEHPGSI